jgi:hypothetical protein
LQECECLLSYSTLVYCVKHCDSSFFFSHTGVEGDFNKPKHPMTRCLTKILFKRGGKNDERE